MRLLRAFEKDVVFISCFTILILTINLGLGGFIVPLYNLWRPTKPDLRALAIDPYSAGRWKQPPCFSSAASDAYFVRVQQSGSGTVVEFAETGSERSGLRYDVTMLVKRSGNEYIENASIVNGCIEVFTSKPELIND